MPQKIDQRWGVPIQPVLNSTTNVIYRDGFETLDSSLWDVVQANGDMILPGGNTAGSGYMKISKSLDNDDTETIITSKFIVSAPVRIALGMSLSQRLQGQRFSFSLVGVDYAGNVISEIPLDSPIAISTIQQTTTTLTVTTATNHGYVPGDRVNISGVTADSRFNYGEVYVATVVALNQFTVTATPYGTISSVTAGPYTNQGSVTRIDPLNSANDEFAMVWEGTSSTNMKLISRSQKSTIYNSTDQYMPQTTATVANGNGFADAFNPSYMVDLRYKAEGVIVRTLPMDSTGAPGGIIRRSQIVPDIMEGYKIRIRAKNIKGMTKPVARVVSAVKSGSTTATITTDVAHGLTTGDQVKIYGMRDQTNFANVTTQTAVASVVNSTTFTIAFGVSATATSYGGVVVREQGSFDMGASSQSVQSISVASGLMTVTGNTNWSGFSIGETIELRGVYDTSGVSKVATYDGVYQVANISTTALTLYTTLPDSASVNVGGAVLKRTDLRLHFLRALDYNRQTVEVDGSIGSVSDSQEALPVGVVNTVTVTSNPSANSAMNTDSTTNLAASATFTGTTRDNGTTQGYNRFRATVMAVAGLGHGHLVLEQSVDNVTFRETHRFPIPSDGQHYTFDFPITMRYVRLKFINGATAQTSFFLASTLVRFDGSTDYKINPTFQHTATALAASASFTGVTLNLGPMAAYNDQRAMVTTDQPGTLYLEQSNNGATWRTTTTYAVNPATPGTAQTFVVDDNVVAQYIRVRYVNGATLQGSFELVSTPLRL